MKAFSLSIALSLFYQRPAFKRYAISVANGYQTNPMQNNMDGFQAFIVLSIPKSCEKQFRWLNCETMLGICCYGDQSIFLLKNGSNRSYLLLFWSKRDNELHVWICQSQHQIPNLTSFRIFAVISIANHLYSATVSQAICHLSLGCVVQCIFRIVSVYLSLWLGE